MQLNINLNVSYGNIKALHGIQFFRGSPERSSPSSVPTVPEKSTTLRAISRMIPLSGRICFRIQRPKHIKIFSRQGGVKTGISHVPEGRRNFRSASP